MFERLSVFLVEVAVFCKNILVFISMTVTEKNMNEEQKKDELIEELGQGSVPALNPLLQWIITYIKVIGLVLVLIVGGVGGYAWYQNHQKVQVELALEELGSIVAQKDSAKKKEDLLAFLKTASKEIQGTVRLELIEVYRLEQDYKNSLEQWRELAKTKDATVKTLALLGVANDLVHLANFDEALSVLNEVKTVGGKAYEPIVLGKIALVAELAGKWQEALAAYKELQGDIRNPNKEFINYKIDQIQQKINKG